MKRSESSNEISTALAKAQAEMKNPALDAMNPHFRNKFASLAAIRNSIVPIFAKHGLSVNQELTSTDTGVACTTIINHASGQWMEFGPLVMPVSKNDAQGFGSASTYCKRYSLQAVGAVVGDEDDDAEAAQNRKNETRGTDHQKVPPAKAKEWADKMVKALDEDIEEDVKSLRVFDIHAAIRADSDVYIAASDLLTPKARTAWRAYVEMGQKIGNQPANMRK